MGEAITIHEATHPSREVLLPCGLTVAIRRLPLKEYTICLILYGHLVEPMAVRFQREPTQEEIRQYMPAVLAEMGAVPVSAELRLMFLRHFCPGITAEILDAFDMADLEALWVAIWEDNAIPFEQRRLEMIADGSFQKARNDWQELHPVVTSSDFIAFLLELGVTPDASESSPASSRSRSRKSKSATSTSRRRGRGTGAG